MCQLIQRLVFSWHKSIQFELQESALCLLERVWMREQNCIISVLSGKVLLTLPCPL